MEMAQAVFITCLKDEVSSASVWDAYNGTLLSRYRGGGSCNFHGVGLSGGYLLSCEKGKPLLHAWPLNKQHPEAKRLIGPGKVSALAFSRDSSHIALAVDEKLFLYQAVSGKQLGIGSKHFQHITVVKFSDDGTMLCCGGEDGLVTVWNISSFCLKEKNPEPQYSFPEHTLPISDILFSSGNNRSRIISVSIDRTCKIYDLISGKLLLSLVFDVQLSSVALSPVQMELYIGNSEGGIHEFSLSSPPRTLEYHLQGEQRKPVFTGHEKSVSSLVCTLDCCHIISGSADETVKIWHIKSRQCLRTLLQKGPVTNVLLELLPKAVFGHEFKPQAFIHDFINPANVDEDEEPYFDIMTPVDLMDTVSISNKSSIKTFGGIQSEPLKQEIDKLKSINNSMYRYAITRILERRYPKKSSEINSSQVISTGEFQAKKKKKRQRTVS